MEGLQPVVVDLACNRRRAPDWRNRLGVWQSLVCDIFLVWGLANCTAGRRNHQYGDDQHTPDSTSNDGTLHCWPSFILPVVDTTSSARSRDESRSGVNRRILRPRYKPPQLLGHRS